MSVLTCDTVFELVRGDDWPMSFQAQYVSDATTNPYTFANHNLTSATITFTVKYSNNDGNSDAISTLSTATSGVTITSAANGQFTVKVPDTDSIDVDIPYGQEWVDLIYDIQVVYGTSSGSFVSGDKETFIGGRIRCYKDTTI